MKMRSDQVENLIDEAIKADQIAEGIPRNLIKELDEFQLLKPLLRHRIKKMIQKVVSNSEKSQEKDEATETNSTEIQREDRNKLLNSLAHEWFNHQTDKCFLDRHDELEKVSFMMFRTRSKGISVEAHQRLIENEESWEEIIGKWGIAPEINNGGKYLERIANKLPAELQSELRRLKVGEISEPFRIRGKVLVIVKLIKWSEYLLSEETRRSLEKKMLDEWLTDQVHKCYKVVIEKN